MGGQWRSLSPTTEQKRNGKVDPNTYIVSDEPLVTDLGNEKVGNNSLPISIKLNGSIHVVIDGGEGLVRVTGSER